jgi:hypothetical protein
MSNLRYHNSQRLRQRKNIRKKRGDRLERNRDLIKEYPWLCPCLGDDGEIPEDYDYHYTLVDLLPSGWHDLILGLCADLKELLDKHDLTDRYRVAEAKEKWFMLRWYDYLTDGSDMPQDIVDLVMRYEEQSQYVCMLCGCDKESTKPCCTSCMAIYY